MSEILARAKTVRELLKGVRYSVDYYQREYKWQEKQIRELFHDLWSKFSEEFDLNHERQQVANYPHYFLGSIIISKKETNNFIVDGQQRLTSLTLLLLLLRQKQSHLDGGVDVDELIVSKKFGQKSFNLDIDERKACMEALYEGQPFDPTDYSESVHNLSQRYSDLEQAWPEELDDQALPYFVDWLLEKVHLVEIVAYSDDDAYTIFETMNDRGLSLSPTEMLKGYLLSNITTESNRRVAANELWRREVLKLNETGKDIEADFFKAWLRSQYAEKIRERRKNAHPEDFDRIGTEFHRWLRDASSRIGLTRSDDFVRFIHTDFKFFSSIYRRLVAYSNELTPGFEHIFYNAQLGFTLQYMVLLAPLKPSDSEEAVRQKLRLVARYLDILLARRIWNFRSIAYSTMQYAMFLLMRDIRALSPEELSHKLYHLLGNDAEDFRNNDRLRMHQQNRYTLHRLLARMTDYIEVQSGQPSNYLHYVSDGKSRFEVEHIWADRHERHAEEFPHPTDFSEYRNRIGGLLLLPKKFNASYGDLPYEEKQRHYNAQNLLTRSLHPQCYEHNPGFLQFIRDTGLPFRAYSKFNKAELDERSELYLQLAELVWRPETLLQ